MMKKTLVLGILLCGIFLGGCQDRRHIADLQSLQVAITTLQHQLLSGTIDTDDAEVQALNLIASYKGLTQQEIATTMQSLSSSLQLEKQEMKRLGTLPIWATQLGLSLPQGMRLQRTLSQQITANTSGYASFTLVYKGSDIQAQQEAVRIASGAHLALSPEILQAQKLIQQGQTISGLDMKDVANALVYTNHTVLDSNIGILLSVSVDPQGLLTLHGTNYSK